jgi:hypothetical protein
MTLVIDIPDDVTRAFDEEMRRLEKQGLLP